MGNEIVEFEGYAIIKTKSGKDVSIDLEDISKLKKYTWNVQENGLIFCRIENKKFLMSRFIMNADENTQIKVKNGIANDMRKENLLEKRIKGNKTIKKDTYIIFLTNVNDEIVIDEEDFDKIKGYTWYVNHKGFVEGIGYEKDNYRQKKKLHSIIMDTDSGKPLFHLNGNVLDNRKINLSYNKGNEIINQNNVTKIKIASGEYLIIDKEDWSKVSNHTWYIDASGYGITNIMGDNGNKLRIHRIITNAPEDKVVDHINHNTLDNRKCNLRVCDTINNTWNSRSRINSSSKYKGVTLIANNKWLVSLRTKDKSFNIGVFTNEIASANAYNFHASQIFGEYAYLNTVPFMSKTQWETFKSKRRDVKLGKAVRL